MAAPKRGNRMLRVLTCLGEQHDLSFVLVAAIVCVAGSAMTIRLFDRAKRLTASSRIIWVLLSGVAGGTAIWTTHFVAMLGFHPPTGYAYAPLETLASLMFAMSFTAAGLYLAARAEGSFLVEGGGALIGAGIAAMHFTGMRGLVVAGRIEWDTQLVLASIVFGIGFGVAATWCSVRSPSKYAWLLGALALTLAICTMHFTAMGAASFMPDASATSSPRTFSSELISLTVVATISIVTGLALYIVDARSQREMLDGFRHAALHDPLTGLPNRASLAARLPAMLVAAEARGLKLAVIVMDLDRFKDINDVHGHRAGDALLRTLTARLKEATSRDEFVARVGGDEFIAVKQHVAAQNEVLEFAARLVACASQPVVHHDHTLAVGASLGVSLYPRDAESGEELIAVADLAMYRAKQQVTDKICFYDQSMDEGRRAKSVMSVELRGALERDEFVLHYQPQIDVGSGEVTGFEALIRWSHPRRGLVAPGEFIPIAEETGLIVPIGSWVLRTACAEAARWRKPYKIAVNIAAAQLTQSGLPRLVHEILLETGLSPSRLELEITEASIINDHNGTLRVVRHLKALGVTIAMDDYGTGYSSLSTLQVFPFDKLKIDRSFIDGVTSNKASMAIVRATILMAASLDIPVLAEGVERQDHFDFLRGEGCSEVQGFLFGRPLPLSEITALSAGEENVPQPQAAGPVRPEPRRTTKQESAADILPATAVARQR